MYSPSSPSFIHSVNLLLNVTKVQLINQGNDGLVTIIRLSHITNEVIREGEEGEEDRREGILGKYEIHLFYL